MGPIAILIWQEWNHFEFKDYVQMAIWLKFYQLGKQIPWAHFAKMVLCVMFPNCQGADFCLSWETGTLFSVGTVSRCYKKAVNVMTTSLIKMVCLPGCLRQEHISLGVRPNNWWFRQKVLLIDHILQSVLTFSGSEEPLGLFLASVHCPDWRHRINYVVLAHGVSLSEKTLCIIFLVTVHLRIQVLIGLFSQMCSKDVLQSKGYVEKW